MYDLMANLLSIDGGMTLLPPLVAIGFALATKRVIPSLAIAVAVGAIIAGDGMPLDSASVLAKTIADIVIDADKWMITGFSLAVAATVGVMGRSGGTRALISAVEAYAQGRRGAMVTTWLSGAVVFFDDYANCLVVGSSMGPLCDRYRVSRAKLAYIVDATAAPIASLAVVSTWVGYEVGLFEDPLKAAEVGTSAFTVFLAALPYRFYCIFTLVFVGAIALSGRDFGPMAVEERKTRSTPAPTGEVDDPTGSHWWLAALPVATLVVMTFGLLVQSGYASLGADAAGARLFEIIGAANPYPPMLIGSLLSLGIAAAASIGVGSLDASEAVKGATGAMKPVGQALAVLYLAWLLGGLIEVAGTGTYLSSMLGDRMSPWMLPVVTFLLSAGTAFSVGSSFFTMGALIPIVLPLALALEGNTIGPIVLASCAAVLDGAVLGDHASPISDTTILSALGSTVDVVLHVNTQLPYVLTVGAIAVVFGSLPAGLGLPVGVSILGGCLASVAAVLVLGRSTEPEDATPEPDRIPQP